MSATLSSKPQTSPHNNSKHTDTYTHALDIYLFILQNKSQICLSGVLMTFSAVHL